MAKQKTQQEDNSVTHPTLMKYMGYCLYKAAMKLKGSLDKGLSALNMVTMQYGILNILVEDTKVTQIEMAKAMGIDQASMVRFLDGLEKQGYIERTIHKTDRRAKVIKITESGEKILLQARKISKGIVDQFAKKLSDPERETLRELLTRLV